MTEKEWLKCLDARVRKIKRDSLYLDLKGPDIPTGGLRSAQVIALAEQIWELQRRNDVLWSRVEALEAASASK